MGILINRSTRVIVQGITGREGSFHARDMAAYGTNIVAGVNPGKGGIWVMDDKVPVFDTMATAMEATEAEASIVFVPPDRATDALYEAADSGVELVVCITEGIPVHDIVKVCAYMKTKGVRLVGPNCPGIITPGESKLGLYPTCCAVPGNVGIITRSSALSYLLMEEMGKRGVGVSSCIGIGGDIICGTTYVDALEMFEGDPRTERVLLIGEIGGLEEERAAKYAAYKMSKPVTAYVTGQHIPAEKRISHAGAYIEGGIGTVRAKLDAFNMIGIRATANLSEIVEMMTESVH